MSKKRNEDKPTIIFPKVNKNDHPRANKDNFLAILKHHNLKGGINVFTKKSGIFREDNTPLKDADIISLLNDYNFPIGNRASFEDAVAEEGERINIFKETIEKTPLDTSKSYIKEILSAIEFSEDFLSHISNKDHKEKIISTIWETWLQCVYYQGTIIKKGRYVMRNILVFQGRQNIGKTRFFSLITPEGLFKTAKHFPENKDDLEIQTKALICEIGEFDSMSGKELKDAKIFISEDFDTYRKPYGRESLTYPRMTTFVGTTNKSAMLRDAENTRFWMCEVKRFNFAQLNKILATEEDIWKLWKEVSLLYKGVETLFNQNISFLNSIFEEQNEKFRLENDVEERLRESLDFERMQKGDFDGFTTNKTLLCIIYKDSLYKARKNDEYAIRDMIEITDIKRKNVKVRLSKEQEETQKKAKKVFPIALTKEAKDWIDKTSDIDIFVN